MCSLLTTGTAEGKASKMNLPPSLFRNGLQCGPEKKRRGSSARSLCRFPTMAQKKARNSRKTCDKLKGIKVTINVENGGKNVF